MASTPPPDAPRPGEVLAGKYRVERVLGVGGMGVVVAARHLELETPVALKFMLPKAHDDGEAAARFLREARAAARLRGEHVARVTDFGKLESGSPYIVIEYLEGEDLGELVRRDGRLPPGLAARCIAQACEAIQEAHEHGIIHRDLKPSNLFLTRRPNGQPCIKVLDFGISKFTVSPSDSGALQKTSTGAVFGSPMYMSPEQMRASRHVSPRSDVWSLGATLYELLTGSIPFAAETVMELALKVAEESALPPSSLCPDVPRELDAIVLRCLEKDPERRYQSARELGQALLPFANDGARQAVSAVTVHREPRVDPTAPTRDQRLDLPSTTAVPTLTQATWGSTGRFKRDRKRLLMFVALGTGLLLVGTAAWLSQRSNEPPRPAASAASDELTAAAPIVTAVVSAEVQAAPVEDAAAEARLPRASPSSAVVLRPAVPAPRKPRPATSSKPLPPDDPFADPR